MPFVLVYCNAGVMGVYGVHGHLRRAPSDLKRSETPKCLFPMMRSFCPQQSENGCLM